MNAKLLNGGILVMSILLIILASWSLDTHRKVHAAKVAGDKCGDVDTANMERGKNFSIVMLLVGLGLLGVGGFNLYKEMTAKNMMSM